MCITCYPNRRNENRLCCRCTYNLWQYGVEDMRPIPNPYEMGCVKGVTGHPAREGDDRDPQETLSVKQGPERRGKTSVTVADLS